MLNDIVIPFLRRASLIKLDPHEKALLTVSFLIALSIFLFATPGYGQDSQWLMRYAAAMAKFTVDPGAYSRQAGYPMLAVLTLVPFIKSIILLQAAQALMAMFMPVVIYKSLRYGSPSIAIIGGWVSTASLLPFLWQNDIMPTLTEIFLLVVFTYFCFRSIYEPARRNIKYLFITLLLISFFRPTFLLLLFVFFYILIKTKEDADTFVVTIRRIGIFTMIFFSIHGAASILDHYLYSKINTTKNQQYGKHLFLPAYAYSYGVDGSFTRGPATLQLKDDVKHFFTHAPDQLKLDVFPPGIRDQYKDQIRSPEKITEALFSSSKIKGVKEWTVLFNISTNWFDIDSDFLFLRSAIEQYFFHPKILLITLTRIQHFYNMRDAKNDFLPFSPTIVINPFYDPLDGPATGMSGFLTTRIQNFPKNGTNPFIKVTRLYTDSIWLSALKCIMISSVTLIALGGFLVMISFFSKALRKLWCAEIVAYKSLMLMFLLYCSAMTMVTVIDFRYATSVWLQFLVCGFLSLQMLLKLMGVYLKNHARHSTHL